MHLYELVCLDFDRSRTITLAHDHLISSATFQDLVVAVEEGLLPGELPALYERWAHSRRTLWEMAKTLGADPTVCARLEAQLARQTLTYSDALETVASLLQEQGGFRHPPIQAAVTRLGHATVP